jgi:glycosyltransferase involved in cell wall biosynthesis
MKYEITIPVYNEETTLEKNILSILIFFDEHQLENWYILIADNGSDDNTQTIGLKLQDSFDRIRYIRLDEKGVGLALKTSWLESDADIVGYMDLDLATDLSHLSDVIRLLNSYDVVNGSRLLKSSKVINRSFIRNITSISFNFIAQSFLHYEITDGMCGFKFFHRKNIHNILTNHIDTKGWFFATELLAKSSWIGLNIIELPVFWTDDRNSKVKILRLSLTYLKELLRLNKERKQFINTYEEIL